MIMQSVTDQARNLMLGNTTKSLRGKISALSGELTTGRKHDVVESLEGKTRLLRQVKDRIQGLERTAFSIAEAQVFADMTQESLGAVHDAVTDIGLSLATDGANATLAIMDVREQQANQAFSTVVSRLNTQIGGAYIFSGAKLDSAPLIPENDILNFLEAEIAGLTDANSIASKISEWFDAPEGSGGFLDVAYQGDLDQPRRAVIGENQTVSLGLNAGSKEIRDVLKGLATAAMVNRANPAISVQEKRHLLAGAGTAIMQSEMGLSSQRSQVGMLQQTVERTKAENEAAKSIYQLSYNDLTSVDEFNVASQLTSAQTNLEILYTLTSRLNSLKLVNYLK